MEWSIIIFCYNEVFSIAQVVDETTKVLQDISNDFEIILVNDGSNDGTGQICQSLAANNPFIKLYTHPFNEGIGAALKTGYQNAKKKYVCAIPGDGQFDVNLIKTIPSFNEDTFYSFYRNNTNYNFYRSLLTLGNKTFNRWIFKMNLRDVNWIKVYTQTQIYKADLKLRSSLIETEICAKLILMGAQVIELPSKYIDRRGGSPKGGSLKTLFQAINEIFQLIIEISRFRKNTHQQYWN